MSDEHQAENLSEQDPEAGSPSEEQASKWADLPSGLTPEDLHTAITYSGYPLQAAVANTLRESLNTDELYLRLQEEWAYLDADTGQIRSIDIFGELRLSKTAHRITPFLNVLVECKQSEMPYIFFLRGDPPSEHYDYPEIVGLPDLLLYSRANDGPAHPVSMSIHDMFGFWELPFFDFPCPFAISISKVMRRGSKLELTGEDAYRSLTLPLVKAADHIKALSGSKAEGWFTYRIVICVAVLRAPMFGAYRSEDEDVLVPVPWARVCRLEPQQDSPESIVRYYDCVHESYLPVYLGKLLSGVQAIVSRIEKSANVIAAGRGMGDLDADPPYLGLRALTEEDEIADVDPEHKIRISRLRHHYILGVERSDEDGNEVQLTQIMVSH